MNIRLLLPALLVLSLAACGADPAAESTAESTAASAATTAAATETEAVFGDEAPVTILAEPVDEHGHEHAADDAHDHGDGSEPHAH